MIVCYRSGEIQRLIAFFILSDKEDGRRKIEKIKFTALQPLYNSRFQSLVLFFAAFTRSPPSLRPGL